MRALKFSEYERISGGLMPTRSLGSAGEMSPDLLKPPGGPGDGGAIDWSNLTIDPSWWGGDAGGSAATNSFNFFAQAGNAPSVEFMFTEGNGYGTLSASTPSYNGGGAVPLQTVPAGPDGPDLKFGLEGTSHLGNTELDYNFGISTADPFHPQHGAIGGELTVKW
ncbi:MAG: hypothetical protein ACREPK_01230 [Rhodanobacteraceae bacterium]